MNKIIEQKLKEIEEKENVKIILAVESGSRAWGFSSPDSDYDVRFIYVRKTKEYLKLNEIRDVIEWQLDETLDISGWDIKKALNILSEKSDSLGFPSPFIIINFCFGTSTITGFCFGAYKSFSCFLHSYFIFILLVFLFLLYIRKPDIICHVLFCRYFIYNLFKLQSYFLWLQYLHTVFKFRSFIKL